MTAKEYASTLKGKSITAAYIGPLRLLQNAEMDSTYLPEVIEDPERDQVYYTGNLVKPDAASGLRPYVLIQPYTIVASRDDLCKHGLDYIMCAPEESIQPGILSASPMISGSSARHKMISESTKPSRLTSISALKMMTMMLTG